MLHIISINKSEIWNSPTLKNKERIASVPGTNGSTLKIDTIHSGNLEAGNVIGENSKFNIIMSWATIETALGGRK